MEWIETFLGQIQKHVSLSAATASGRSIVAAAELIRKILHNHANENG